MGKDHATSTRDNLISSYRVYFGIKGVFNDYDQSNISPSRRIGFPSTEKTFDDDF